MPTVFNASSDDLNMPSVGLSLAAGETKEIDEATAAELDGHPLLKVTYDPAPRTKKSPETLSAEENTE